MVDVVPTATCQLILNCVLRFCEDTVSSAAAELVTRESSAHCQGYTFTND